MKNLKILALIFGIAILCTGCQKSSEKIFIRKKVFATAHSSSSFSFVQVGDLYGKAENNKMVLSVSYPNVSSDTSGYELLYDGKRLTGKFKLVGVFTIPVRESISRHGSSYDIVPVATPVYMRTNNFNYLYKTDKKYLIDFLDAIRVTHNLQ